MEEDAVSNKFACKNCSSRPQRTPVSMFRNFLTGLIIFHILSTVSAVRKSHFVHWNTTNPIFRIDNTDHIIDVNQGNKPWEYDQVNIICPVYRPGAPEMETYVIYSVSREEYETCRITSDAPRVIAICNKPHELMYFTITFRSFTPTPGGMEFKPGKDYYFISTSSQDDLYRRIGGHCSTHNMKVAFKVADNSAQSQRPALNVPRRRPTPRQRRPLPPPSWRGVDRDHSLTYVYQRPDYKYSQFDGRLTYDNQQNHPNEVIKHEASVMAEAAAATGPASGVAIPSLALSTSIFSLVVIVLLTVP